MMRFSSVTHFPSARSALLGLAVGSFALGCIENTAPANNDDRPDYMPPDSGMVMTQDSGPQGDGSPGTVAGSGTTHMCASATKPPKPPPAGCDGYYCGTNLAALRAESPTTATCGTDAELSDICAGETAHIMADCGREEIVHVGGPDPGDAMFRQLVSDCAKANPGTHDMSQGCFDCYVDGVVCAKQKCIGPCLAGDTPQCDDCRRNPNNKCTQNFYSCGGIPYPF